ncbi:MAG: hypothetical protein FJ265_17810 [Planctomycetes bacterium]|nr:hypothetical protein [Planctomycetota bacterium]
MSRASVALLATLSALGPLCGQDPSSIRLVPRPPRVEAAAGPAPALRTSFAEAEAAARERRVLLLLYFTAKW